MQTPYQSGDQADFFDELRFWSRTKLRILEKYIAAYMNKRGRFNSTVYYVDAFAGRGYYGQAGQSLEEGSPLRMARFAQRIRDEGRQYRLICLNTELRKDRCQELQKALATFDPELVQVYCGAFTQHLPRILGSMKNAPAVCFLDPFGVVGISADDIKPLLLRPDTEILLNLSTPTLHRLAGFATSDAKEAHGKFNQLSRTLGEDPRDKSPEWLTMRDRLTSDEWEAWAVERYLTLMQAVSPYLKYGMAYPIRQKHGGGVKYYLVFASRAMDAFPLMSDFICTEEDDLRMQAEMASRAPGQMGLFAPAHVTEREARFSALIEEIHAYGMVHQGVNRKHLIEQFSYQYLGEFRQRNFRFMIDQLVEAKRAEFGKGDKDLVPINFR